MVVEWYNREIIHRHKILTVRSTVLRFVSYMLFQCDKTFPWASSLRRHLMTHTGLKPYCCAACKAQFTTKSNLERHVLRRHGVLDKEGQAKYIIKLSQSDLQRQLEDENEGKWLHFWWLTTRMTFHDLCTFVQFWKTPQNRTIYPRKYEGVIQNCTNVPLVTPSEQSVQPKDKDLNTELFGDNDDRRNKVVNRNNQPRRNIVGQQSQPRYDSYPRWRMMRHVRISWFVFYNFRFEYDQ